MYLLWHVFHPHLQLSRREAQITEAVQYCISRREIIQIYRAAVIDLDISSLRIRETGILHPIPLIHL